jgi:nucleoside-diphosphate-sugar epimerase
VTYCGSVRSLKVLFIGGSGIISSACSWLAAERDIELFVLNRGISAHRPLPAQATVLRGDIRDPVSVRDAIGDRDFDAVVNWVAFTPEHVQADIEQGAREIVGWHDEDPSRQQADMRLDAVMDKLIETYQ